jgi:hypothetical protein
VTEAVISTQELAVAKHWYRIDFQDGSKSRTMCGSSDLNPSQLAIELTTGAFIRLEDLVYKDNQSRFRSWTEWDSRIQPIALINSKMVSIVLPFAADPRIVQSTAPTERSTGPE